MSGSKPDLPRDAVAALEHGKKIEAIKIVRSTHGVDLMQAKDIVEEFIESNPDVKNRMAGAKAENAGSGLGWLFLLAAIAALAHYFYAGMR